MFLKPWTWYCSSTNAAVVFVRCSSIANRTVIIHKILGPFLLRNASWSFRGLKHRTLTKSIIYIFRHLFAMMRISPDTQSNTYWLPALTPISPDESFIASLAHIVYTPGIARQESTIGQRVIKSILKILVTCTHNSIDAFIRQSHIIGRTNCIGDLSAQMVGGVFQGGYFG